MATILETVVGSSDFDLLEDAVVAAGLDGVVASLSGATVFAPTDAAFTQTAIDLGYTGDPTDESAVFSFLAGKLTLIGEGDLITGLTAVLSYHISADFLTSGDVTSATEIPVLNGTIGSIAGIADLIDADPDVTDPMITAANVPADNGIIHIIDRILLPVDVQTIDDLVDDGMGPDADNSDYDLLAAALSATGLDAVTSDPSQEITVFAPTDEAFVALAQSLGFTGSDEAGALTYILDVAEVLGQGDPLAVIEDILLYHVISGAQDSSGVIAADGDSLPTLLGPDLGVDIPNLVDAASDFADPSLILDRLDTYAVNGIVHAIDGVLLPVDLDAETGIFIGTDASEEIEGTSVADLINGKDGDDHILAGNGDDIALGGLGNDEVNGEAGNDILLGGAGNDSVKGASGDDQITGGTGHDMLWGGGGDDTFFFAAGDGTDEIRGFTQDDRIVIEAESYAVTELKGTSWLISYGEGDSILVKGNAKVDIDGQIDLMMA